MGWPKPSVNDIEAGKRLASIKQCPITCGRPTRMTEEAFAALCARMRGSAGGWKYNHRKHTGEAKGWCQVCQGKQRPKELKLIAITYLQREARAKQQPQPTITNGDNMAKVRGVCEGGCNTNGLQVATVHGVKMCSTCGTIHAHVKNRQETVVAAIRRTGMLPWYVQQLVGETVTAQGESATLAAISEVVGYDGESPDGLVGAVRACVEAATDKSEGGPACVHPDVIKALGMDDEGQPWSAQDFELAIIQQAAQLEHLEQLSSYLCLGLGEVAKTVGVDAHDFRRVTLAVAQTEAIIEALGAVVGATTPTDIVPAVSTLTANFERLQKRSIERLHELTDLATDLADRLSEYERANLINEQVFAQLRELIDADGLANAELPGVIRNALHPAETPSAPLAAYTQPNIDGHLLDIALDVMRGDIQGLDPDRIAALRGAAH